MSLSLRAGLLTVLVTSGMACSQPAPSGKNETPPDTWTSGGDDTIAAPDADEDTAAPLPDVAAEPDTAPDPDVGPDVVTDPCEALECPPDSVCQTHNGEAACWEIGSVVETFDTPAQSDAELTTAAWGGGVLTPSLADLAGTGNDGAFEPDADLVIDTTAGGAAHFTSFVVKEGVTVTVTGPNPWDVRVLGDVTIEGVIRSDGGHGGHVCNPKSAGGPPGAVGVAGGAAGAGGGQGGNGGAGYGQEGQAGAGPGGGEGGVGSTSTSGLGASGSGGGGFGNAGADGVDKPPAVGGKGGPAYGSDALAELAGGSGGGGGHGKDKGGNDGTCDALCADDVNCYLGICQGKPTYQGDGVLNDFDRPGGGGGGGGGAIALSSGGTVTIRGLISVNGGNGGWGDWSGGGGGGSGGAIRLRALDDVVLEGGTLAAQGGRGGLITCSNQSTEITAGDGAGGRIRLEALNGVATGYLMNPAPAPSFAPLTVFPDGGTGEHGAFEPTQDVTLDTEAGAFQFSSFTLPAGVTLTATGSQPLEIQSQGPIIVLGTIDLSGLPGGNGYSACCGNPYSNAHGGPGGAPGSPFLAVTRQKAVSNSTFRTVMSRKPRSASVSA